MSDDLVKRARHNALSDMPHYASVELIEALADRIEELEAKLDWVITERDETFALMLDRAQTAEAKLSKSEALLAKAVEFAEIVERCGHGALWDLARTTLAELKGEADAT